MSVRFYLQALVAKYIAEAVAGASNAYTAHTEKRLRDSANKKENMRVLTPYRVTLFFSAFFSAQYMFCWVGYRLPYTAHLLPQW